MGHCRKSRGLALGVDGCTCGSKLRVCMQPVTSLEMRRAHLAESVKWSCNAIVSCMWGLVQAVLDVMTWDYTEDYRLPVIKIQLQYTCKDDINLSKVRARKLRARQHLHTVRTSLPPGMESDLWWHACSVAEGPRKRSLCKACNAKLGGMAAWYILDGWLAWKVLEKIVYPTPEVESLMSCIMPQKIWSPRPKCAFTASLHGVWQGWPLIHIG